jgi:transcriptional regulator with XRE-family HTH domain
MPADANPRATTEIDRMIGAQIRLRRASARLSQEALAEAIGVTFQQIQKYEKGVNRVSAAALYRIGRALGVEPSVLMPRDPAVEHAPEDMKTFAALAYPIARLNPAGRDLLIVLAQALASQSSLRMQS